MQRGGTEEGGLGRGRNTTIVVLLVPIRVAGYILWLLLLLLPALIEHLLEELELGFCACDEEESC